MSSWGARIEAPPEVELCRCGCGEQQNPDTVSEALQLAAARRTAKALTHKLHRGGETAKAAEHLLWAWGNCSDAMDALVHDRPPRYGQGPPTTFWLNSWMQRAAELSDKPRRHRRWPWGLKRRSKRA